MEADLPADGVFARVERIHLPKWRSWLNCIAALPSDTPLQVAYYRNREFQKRAVALCAEHDGVFAHLIRTADAIKNTPGVKFLEMTDAISLNYERVRQMKGAPRDLRMAIFSLEARRLRKYEESIVDHFNCSVLVSEVDRQHLYANDHGRLAKVIVCSNGVDLSTMPYQFEATGSDIIFIGNMLSLQNCDAALYMATAVMPLISRVRPASRLRLIGRISQEKKAQLEIIPNVSVTGEVADVSIAARGGVVGVCPLRLGAGVQNKVLEYMALGLPTVSTTLGLEGFSAVPGEHLLIADDAENFANATLALMTQRERASTMAMRARAYVEIKHSWQGMLAPLIKMVKTNLM